MLAPESCFFGAVPSAAPTSVTAVEVGPLKIHVVWGPVECIHRNGAITGYRVCHTNLNTLSKICSPSSGGGTSLDISVSSGGVYGVQVAGINAVGEGPFSNEVMIEVAEPGKHQMNLLSGYVTFEVFLLELKMHCQLLASSCACSATLVSGKI